MKLWQIMTATLLAVLLAGFLAGALWQAVFNFELPAYIAGVVGGVTAVPVWTFLRRHRHGRRKDSDDRTA